MKTSFKFCCRYTYTVIPKTSIKECLENNRRLEEKNRLLDSRVVDANAKPSKGTENEAMVFSQSQDIIKLKDQLVQK